MATPHLRQRFLSHCYMDVGFPGGSDGKESTCNAGDPGLIPGWEDPLGKEMATHSSIPAWRIPWAEEPDRLQSMGSQRVGHDWATNAFTFYMAVDPLFVECERFTVTLWWPCWGHSMSSDRREVGVGSVPPGSCQRAEEQVFDCAYPTHHISTCSDPSWATS